MTKLVKVKRADPKYSWVEVDTAFLDHLPQNRRFGHISCGKCGSSQFNIGVWGGEEIRVGCTKCAWEMSVPYRVTGAGHLVLPV